MPSSSQNFQIATPMVHTAKKKERIDMFKFKPLKNHYATKLGNDLISCPKAAKE